MSAKKSKSGLIFILVVIGIAIGGYATREGGWLARDVEAALDGAVVQRGNLRISETVRGNLRAKDSISIKSSIEGTSTILTLIEEGTQVEPGDLIAQLDVSKMRDNRVVQEIAVQNASAELTKAVEQYGIQEIQNTSDIAAALQRLTFARQDLTKYQEGDWPQQLAAADEAITLAKERMARAEDTLKWSTDLEQRGFVQRTELEADEFAAEAAKIEWNQAVREKELLEEFEHPRRLAELEADIEESERDLERVKKQANARLADYEAARESAIRRLDLEQEKLRKLEDQISKGEIRSPSTGIVVYGRSSSRYGGGEPVQEGGTIRERQEIVSIPSSTGMIVDASLHETVLERVRVGLPCAITIDAIPGESFAGRVDFVATLPDSGNWFSDPNQRVYRAEVSISNPIADMRPGMSCRVEILAEDLTDVVYVPVQSVFVDAGNPICFVREGQATKRVPVEVGLDNSKWVTIEKGLREGQTVLLSPPSDFVASTLSKERKRAPKGAPAAGGEPSGSEQPGAEADAAGVARGAAATSAARSRPSASCPAR